MIIQFQNAALDKDQKRFVTTDDHGNFLITCQCGAEVKQLREDLKTHGKLDCPHCLAPHIIVL